MDGEWTGMYIPSNLKIGTIWRSKEIILFFGKRSQLNIITPVDFPRASVDYFMYELSIRLKYKESKEPEPEYDRDLNMIYNNGEVKIYKLPR